MRIKRYDLAHAAGTDAANRNMTKNGRKSWNEDDYSICVDEFNRIYPEETQLKVLTGELTEFVEIGNAK